MPKVDRPKPDGFMLADALGADPPVDRVLALIREQLDRIRFGSIALSIHDGRVVQLEILEKKRLT